MTETLECQPVDPATWTNARVLVVVAHPDDEILGCGALLSRLRDVRVVHVTDGAPRSGADAIRHGFATPEDYATARRREAVAALALADVSAARLCGLGLHDQAVSLNLAGVARALIPMLQRADIVLTHAYEGGHSDHDAVAFAVHAAHRLCDAESSRTLIEMPFYFGDADGWVRQRFLPHAGAGSERVLALSFAERHLKDRMIEAHHTQADTLMSFSRDCERFRTAPHYDFRARPHDGPLLYERHQWNLTAAQWRARVGAAQTDLGLGTPACP